MLSAVNPLNVMADGLCAYLAEQKSANGIILLIKMTTEEKEKLYTLLQTAAGLLNTAHDLYVETAEYKAYEPKIKRYADRNFHDCIDPIGLLSEKLELKPEN
jgi:hypothetical protein